MGIIKRWCRALIDAVEPSIESHREMLRLGRLVNAKKSVALYERAIARERAGLEKAQAAEARALADIRVADAAKVAPVPAFLLKRQPDAPAVITPLDLPRQRARVVRRGPGSVTPIRAAVARRSA